MSSIESVEENNVVTCTLVGFLVGVYSKQHFNQGLDILSIRAAIAFHAPVQWQRGSGSGSHEA